MPKVEIYTKDYCPYCHRAKSFLSARGVNFTEYDVTYNRDGEAEMRRRSGRRTVPQIFVDGVGIGGSDDLVRLDRQGKLTPLLTGQTA